MRGVLGLAAGLVLILMACAGGASPRGTDAQGDGGASGSSSGASAGGSSSGSSSGGGGSSGGSSSGGAASPVDASFDATGSTPGNGAPPFGVAQTGVATYYDGDGTGACSFDADPAHLDYAAMDQPEWAGSAVCGACASVVGPSGSVTVRIVDLCPGCEAGHLDLSPQAFQAISPLSAGRVAITWTLVPCDVTGNVAYRYKDGSSQYWTAIQVLNARFPVAKLEWKGPSGYASVPLASYDYFVQASGVGTGSVAVRITAWDGQTLEDTLPAPAADEDGGTVVTGAGQFDP